MEEIQVKQATALRILSETSLTELSPGTLGSKYHAVKTANEAALVARNERSKTLGTLVREKKSKPVKVLIWIWLVHLNEMSGVKNGLTAAQMDYIADELVDDMTTRNLNMIDVKVVINGAIEGAYGELYERITPGKVLGWFREYMDQRAEAWQRIREDEHGRIKREMMDNLPREGKRDLRTVMEQWKRKKWDPEN